MKGSAEQTVSAVSTSSAARPASSSSVAQPSLLDTQILREVEDLGHYPTRSKTAPKNEIALRKKLDKQWKNLSEETQEKLNALKHSA